jgi:hypothetical protein
VAFRGRSSWEVLTGRSSRTAFWALPGLARWVGFGSGFRFRVGFPRAFPREGVWVAFPGAVAGVGAWGPARAGSAVWSDRLTDGSSRVSKKGSSAASCLGAVVSFLIVGVLVAGAIVLIFEVDVSAAEFLSFAVGALCLAWMIVLLVVPWNVHFQARELIKEIGTSRDAGLEVKPGREEEVRRIARRTLWVAIGGHLLSAAVITVITYFAGSVIGYYFAGFYLVSTLFRPAHAWFVHLHGRLTAMLQEVRHPRDDVLDLKERITFLEAQGENLRQTTEQLHTADLRLEQRLETVDVTTTKRDDELDRRLDALARQFEDTVAHLTDNQEVIAGIKAFLRLLRTESA